MKADLLITNANIITMDDNGTRAGSLAVRNGRITGVWIETEPPKHIVGCSELLNLEGATVLPGFIDTHNHMINYGVTLELVNFQKHKVKTIQDMLDVVKSKVKTTPQGGWIQCVMYDDTLLDEQRHITRQELDVISPNHPVYLKHISGHLVVVNSVALELAGVADDIEDPQGGHYGRAHDGKLDGVLYERDAMQPVREALPYPTEEEMIAAIRESSKEYLAQGITMSSDLAVGRPFGVEEFDAHFKAAKNGINPIRMRLMVFHQHMKEGGIFGKYSAAQLDQFIQDQSAGRAKLDGAKMFQDGSIQGYTGALREPYYSKPDIRGKLVHPQESFNKEILDLHKRGFRIAIHGNGDKAIESILDAYHYAQEHFPRKDSRHRIEHVQTATSEDLHRMRELGVAGSFFINHVYYWGDRHERMFLGPERAKRISPIKEAFDRQLLVSLHSDLPVTPISPLFSIWAAVNRLTREGRVLGPDQRVSVEMALRAMTIEGAKIGFDEENAGSLEIGKRADFVMLDEDPTEVDPKHIRDISVTATYIDGLQVYKKQ